MNVFRRFLRLGVLAKIVGLAVTLVVTSVAAGLITTQVVATNLAEKSRHQVTTDLAAWIEQDLVSQRDTAAMLASQAASTPSIQKAFAAGDRAGLLALTMPTSSGSRRTSGSPNSSSTPPIAVPSCDCTSRRSSGMT